MAIEVTCPRCGKRYQVPDSRAGETGRCSCGAEVVVPQRQPMLPEAEPRCLACGATVAPGEEYCPHCVARRGGALGFQEGAIGRGMERPVGIAVLAVLTWIGSGLGVLGSLILLAGGASLGAGARTFAGASGDAVAMGAMAGLLVAVAVLTLAMSAFSAVVAYFLWNGARWARIVFIVMQSIGLVMGLANLAVRATSRMPTGFETAPGAAGGLAIVVMGLCINVLFLAILLSRPAREFCAR